MIGSHINQKVQHLTNILYTSTLRFLKIFIEENCIDKSRMRTNQALEIKDEKLKKIDFYYLNMIKIIDEV